MSTKVIKAAHFVCMDYSEEDEARECFEPLQHKDFETMKAQRLAVYSTLAPKQAPEVVMLPVSDGMDLLQMYTHGLHHLYTPKELCLRKALEFIEDLRQYECSVAIFRNDLTQQLIDVNDSYEEIDSLINGIGALAENLLETLRMHGLFKGERLAYCFDNYLENGNTLVLRKFSYYDGNNVGKQKETVTGSDYCLPKAAAVLCV